MAKSIEVRQVCLQYFLYLLTIVAEVINFFVDSCPIVRISDDRERGGIDPVRLPSVVSATHDENRPWDCLGKKSGVSV